MMFTMRSHHMLTDVVLEVGNELFHVHKVVLAAGSPYFKVSSFFLHLTCNSVRVKSYNWILMQLSLTDWAEILHTSLVTMTMIG